MINLLLSTEKINDIQICPTLYNYKHELSITPLKKPDFYEEGELMHAILALYYQSKMEKNVISTENLINFGRNYAAKNLNTLTAEQVEVVMKHAKMYFDYYGNNESWEILGVEEPFAKELYANNQIKIIVVGKDDLRIKANRGNGPVVIVDHKYEARFDQKVERDNQPLAYCWAYEVRDFIYNRIGKHKGKDRKVEDNLQRPWLSYAQYQINDWVDSVIESAHDLLRYLSNNKFPMRIHGCNVHGRKCTFYDICNTTPDNREYKINSFFKNKDKFSVMGNETSKGTISSPEEIQEEG